MRILALTPTYYPAMGGAERTLHELYARIGARGHSVDLLAPNLGGAAAEDVNEGFRVLRLGHRLRGRAHRLLRYQIWQARAIRRLRATHRYDLAVSTYGIWACFLQPLIQRRWGLPFIIKELHFGTGADIETPDENPILVEPLLRRSYRAAEAVLTNSTDTARFVRQVAKEARVHVMPQGADHILQHPGLRSDELRARMAPGRFLLLTVSRLSARKNLVAMVDAIGLVRRQVPDVRLLIAGDGPERGRIERRVAELGLTDHVHLLGFVPDQELLALRASADLFLSTARYEGFGLSIVEAMAAGVPAVAFPARGIDEFLADGSAGFITEPRVEAFADAVVGLLADDARRRRMGQAGRALVEKQFNWDRYADEHIRLFASILAQRATPLPT